MVSLSNHGRLPREGRLAGAGVCGRQAAGVSARATDAAAGRSASTCFAAAPFGELTAGSPCVAAPSRRENRLAIRTNSPGKRSKTFSPRGENVSSRIAGKNARVVGRFSGATGLRRREGVAWTAPPAVCPSPRPRSSSLSRDTPPVYPAGCGCPKCQAANAARSRPAAASRLQCQPRQAGDAAIPAFVSALTAPLRRHAGAPSEAA